jgi:DNA-binding FadR family transcriptional regulator
LAHTPSQEESAFRLGGVHGQGALESAPRQGAGKRNANDALVVALGGEIIAGVYPEGSRLPAESALLERFKVSRPTLREAFRVLAAKGLIVSRQRVGTRVRPRSDWNMLDPDFLAWHLQTALTEGFVAHLFQLRQMIEPQAAYFAAQTRSPQAIARIKAAYFDMERWRKQRSELASADLRFHRSILDATGNPFVGALGGLIQTALVGTFRLGWSETVLQEDRLRQHRAVLEAIEEGAPIAARERMAALLQDSIDDVRRVLLKTRAEAKRAPNEAALR